MDLKVDQISKQGGKNLITLAEHEIQIWWTLFFQVLI